MATTDFVPYAEEPQDQKSYTVWDKRLNRLKEFPAGWYVVAVFETAPNQASTYKSSFSKKDKYKDFKFQAGRTEKGSKLYARYIPNDDPATAETAKHHQPRKKSARKKK